MIPYEPDNVEDDDDIIKHFPFLTIEDLNKLEQSELYEKFLDDERKLAIVRYVRTQASKINKFTTMTRRGELVVQLCLCDWSITAACDLCKISRSRFWELRPRWIEKWNAEAKKTWDLYTDLTATTGLYHIVWSQEHIREQLNAAHVDRRKTRTIISDMLKEGLDPYSTTRNTVTTYLNKCSKTTTNRLSTLQHKQCLT